MDLPFEGGEGWLLSVLLLLVKCRAGTHSTQCAFKAIQPRIQKPLQFLFPIAWKWGKGIAMFLVCTCACVSVVVTPPSPHLSLSRFLSPHLLHPLCVFHAVFSLLAVGGEHQLLHYIDGESPPPLCTLSLSLSESNYSALWKSSRDLAILVEQANGGFPYLTLCVVIHVLRHTDSYHLLFYITRPQQRCSPAQMTFIVLCFILPLCLLFPVKDCFYLKSFTLEV